MVYDGKIWVGTSEDGIPAFLLPQMANRHGLIAGATGTGKTVTLKVIAESFSAMGVPVFLGDIKSDLSGMVLPGEANKKINERLAKAGITDFTYQSFPTVYWDVYGESGHPVRTTVEEMGSLLLARMLSLNEIQSGVLNILFRVAKDEGMPLIDIKDIKAMLVYLGENADKYTLNYGNVSKASIGAIQRAIAVLESQGGNCFFGEPSLKITDWMQQDESGKGYINIMACDRLFLSPLMYSTFMLWMLTSLYESLPEVGDLEKPRMVFFFDEAHLLFADCSKQLMEKIEQVVRLIRSKGVGVYFITQNPTDVPMTVLGQLGNRVQHALRAYTPLDQKAVKVAAQTFRANSAFNTEDAITQLQTGEALISFLDASGAPGIVQRVTILPPQSHMGAISEGMRQDIIASSPFHGIYENLIERESAYEMLGYGSKTEGTEQPAIQTIPIFNPDMIRSVFNMANPEIDQNNLQQAPVQQPVMQQPVMQQPVMQQPVQPAQGFMAFDPTTGTYVQQAVQPVQQFAQQAVQQFAQPVQQFAQQVAQPVQQAVQQFAQPVQQAAQQLTGQQAQTIQQNMLVQDPVTGMYTQKLVTLAYDAASGQYVRVMTEEEIKAAAKAQEAAEKAAAKNAAAAAKAAKEAEAAERRQRTDELREERAERARANNSVMGRVKNTAISTATRTVTNKLINSLTKGIANSLKKK